jgi:sugar phosphate isomerase/epimerase
VGVCVDTYHVWWDPDLESGIARAGAGGRIHAYQEADWLVPIPADALLGRGHVGDGVIDVERIRGLVRAAGYRGFVEVEIFNDEVWAAPGIDTIGTVAERHRGIDARLRPR